MLTAMTTVVTNVVTTVVTNVVTTVVTTVVMPVVTPVLVTPRLETYSPSLGRVLCQMRVLGPLLLSHSCEADTGWRGGRSSPQSFPPTAPMRWRVWKTPPRATCPTDSVEVRATLQSA